MSGREELEQAEGSLEDRLTASLADAKAGRLTRHQSAQALMEHLEAEQQTVGPDKPGAVSLRNGWELKKLEDVVDILDSKRVPINSKERETRQGPIPYYGATGQVGWIDDFLFNEELVLLGEDGAPFLDPAKQKAYVILGKSWVNNHAHVLRAKNGIPNAYIKYYLDIVDYHNFVTGTTRLKLNQAAMRQIPVPVAPPDLQKRIVAEIEKQFSRLDEAVANLKRVKANLKRYKAAVLKAAVEGRLVETEADLARREGRSYETGEQLLQRILETRRNQWQGKGKYKAPAAPDTTNLPELPEGWVWATVDLVCEQIVDCPHSTARFKPVGFPCIDTTWMTTNGLAIERARYVDEVTYQERIARLEPKPGDIVFAREGTIGTAVLVPEMMKPCLGQRVMLLRPSIYFVGIFLMHTLLSEIVKSQYRAQALGSTVPHINVGDVKLFRVPLPPLAEQYRIVAEVDRRLSLLRETEAQVDANLQRAERLRQSVLSNAFSYVSSHRTRIYTKLRSSDERLGT